MAPQAEKKVPLWGLRTGSNWRKVGVNPGQAGWSKPAAMSGASVHSAQVQPVASAGRMGPEAAVADRLSDLGKSSAEGWVKPRKPVLEPPKQVQMARLQERAE